MELNEIKKQGKWTEISDTLNENFAKVNAETQRIELASRKNKGYYATYDELTNIVPQGDMGDIAFIGTNYPYRIYKWDGTAWIDTFETGGAQNVNLADYYTRTDVDNLIKLEEQEREQAYQELDKTLTSRLDVEGTGLMTVDEMINFNPIANEGGSYLVGYLDKPSRYVVTKEVGGVPVNVGILEILSDSNQHIYTQVFTTHFVLDNSGNLDLGSHTDTKLVTYFRSYSIDSPLIDSGTWTKWKDISHYSDIQESIAKNKQDIELLNANTGISEYPTFEETKAYAVGDVVLYEGLLKRFTSAHEAGAWDGSQVEDWSEKKEVDGKVAELGLEVEEVNEKVKIINDSDDLSFSDELGNKIVSFFKGHLKTKNFNSESSASHSDVEAAIKKKKDILVKKIFSADLSLEDEIENVIAQFVGGNIKTKKFNSANYNTSKTDIDLSSAGWIEYEIISGHRYYIYCDKGYKTRVGTTIGLTTSVIERVSYDGDKTNESGIEYDAGMSGIFKATQDATHLRFGNYFKGYIVDLDYSRFSPLLDSPLLIDDTPVELKTDYITKDYSEEISNWDVSDVKGSDGFTGKQKLMEQVYSKLDELAENYPSYLSKEDAYSLVGLEYPSYAKLEGVSSGVYKATPTYKTWLYKLSYDNKDLGNVYVGGLNKKSKIFLIGGTHGEERMQMLNIFYLVKSMLEISDMELWKLFSAFDFYIIPCLCGYGCYHSLRTNFDWADNKGGVNINRNFPYNGWSVKDFGTYNYSGASAGSEPETKLIMKLIEHIKPEIVLDLHNYGGSQNYQFYFACNDANGQRLAYQSLVDLSLVAKRDLPQYFGVNPAIINGNISRSATSGSLAHYASFCKGVLFSATIEVSESINYINGEYNTDLPIDEYGADTMKVAEYTLRNMLIRISRYVLNKLNK